MQALFQIAYLKFNRSSQIAFAINDGYYSELSMFSLYNKCDKNLSYEHT